MSDGSNASKAIAEGIKVTIGGEEHFLRYTLWSFVKIDEATGRNPLEGATWESPRPKDILVLIWAGLQHEQTPPSIEQLGQKISLSQIKELGDQIRVAMAQAIPEEEEKKTSLESTPALEQSATE